MLQAVLAFESLDAQFGPEVARAAATFEVTKASIERAIKERVKPPRGKGAEVLRGALDAIRVCGGITTATTRRVEEHEP